MTDETPDERMRRLITGQYIRPLPRKFYKSVEVSDDNGILLDGRTVKTPMKNRLRLPTRSFATAVAAEWQGQDKVINTETMPLTKLANTALDRAVTEREHILNEIVDYAGSDLVCYWADRPPDLVQLQVKHWQPVLDWANTTLSARFEKRAGIQHVPQPAKSLQQLRDVIVELNPWQLTGLYLVMTLTGSALLALMKQQSAASAEAIWQASHVDEDYQISQWGEDAEAVARRAKRRLEFDGLTQYFQLLAMQT
jgi:chaperone required for assembly of F1-ATPase